MVLIRKSARVHSGEQGCLESPNETLSLLGEGDNESEYD